MHAFLFHKIPYLSEFMIKNTVCYIFFSGELGAMLDSLRILTDSANDRIPTMTFGHIQELCACLKNSGKK